MKTFKQFTLKEAAKRNSVYLHVEFEGGDGDTSHPQSYLIKDVTMENIDEHLDTVNNIIADYKKLQNVLEDTDSNYDDVKSEYGEDVARLYDNAPNDPQSDYQFKCYISSLQLHAYDENGDLYTQYIR